MPDFKFDIVLKNSGVDPVSLTLFSPLTKLSRKTSQFQFLTPSLSSYPAGTSFVLTGSAGINTFTLPVALTPAQLVSELNLNTPYTWAISSGDIRIWTPSGVTLQTLEITGITGTWTLQVVPVFLSFIRSISFFDLNLGLCGTDGVSVCLRTINGGSTWALIPGYPAMKTYSISYVGPFMIYVSGQFSPGSIGCVYKSLNTGLTWSQVFLGTGAGSINGLSFVDALTGWACGTENASVDSIIWHTIDGGATWTPQLTISGAVHPFLDIHFVDSLVGFAITSSARLYRTVDGGTSWNFITMPAITPNKIFAVSAAVVYISGSAGQIRKSIDGGFTVLDVSIITSNDLYGLSFTDVLTGWVGRQDGSIMFTNDGGASWSAQVTGLPSQEVYVSFVDSSHGWAGSDNKIAKYSV